MILGSVPHSLAAMTERDDSIFAKRAIGRWEGGVDTIADSQR